MSAPPSPPRPQQGTNAWTWLIFAGVLLVILAVLALTTIQRLRQHEQIMQQALKQQGLFQLMSLEGATRAGLRMGMWRPGLLQTLVEEMLDRPRVRALGVFDPQGRLLAAASELKDSEGRPDLLAGLPPELVKQIKAGQPVERMLGDELVVGRAFDPFRRPSWAGGSGSGLSGGRHGSGMGPVRHGRAQWRAMCRTWGQGKAYGLVRLLARDMLQARRQAVRGALMLGALIFLGAGAAAWGLWAVARRRSQELERLRRQVAESQHLAALGRLAGSVAHEVRNPLSALKGLVQYLAKDYPPDSPKAEYAQAAVEEVDRLERVVSGLLDYTRPRQPRRLPLDLGELLGSTLAFMRDDPRTRGVEIELQVDPELPQVQADPDQLRQVLLNLVVNALEALDGRGRLTIAARRQGDKVMIRVDDSGPGLPGDDPEQVFDPFFSAKERGTGLGLAIARRIIEAHQGSISAGASPLGGARFTIELPLQGGRS